MSRILPILVLLACAGCGSSPTTDAAALARTAEELSAADPARRWAALRSLLETGPAVAAVLREPVPGELPVARAWRVYLLGRLDRGFAPQPFLADDEAEVRFRAAEALGRRPSHEESDLGLLRQLLADPDGLVRVAAAWALLRVRSEDDALRVLIGSLGRWSTEATAREAAQRLQDLYGSVVPYDVAAGCALRDAARDRWAARLERSGHATARSLVPPPPPPPEPELATLRRLAAQLRQPPAAPRALVAIWRRTIEQRSRHPDAVAGRLAVLARLVKLLPSEGLLHADYAATLRDAGQLGPSLRQYTSARRLHPDLPGLLVDAGVCAEGAGRRDEALGLYTRAATLAPEDDVPLLNAGRVLLALGREQEGVDTLLQAEAEAQGRWPSHRLALGRLLDRAGSLPSRVRFRE